MTQLSFDALSADFDSDRVIMPTMNTTTLPVMEQRFRTQEIEIGQCRIGNIWVDLKDAETLYINSQLFGRDHEPILRVRFEPEDVIRCETLSELCRQGYAVYCQDSASLYGTEKLVAFMDERGWKQ